MVLSSAAAALASPLPAAARGAITPVRRFGSFADFRDAVSRTFVPLAVSSRRPHDTTRPYTLAFDETAIRTIVLMFPQRLAELSGERMARLTATALDRDDPLGGMVGTVLEQLAGRLELLRAGSGWRLGRNAVDLVNILLRERLGQERALPAERLFDQLYGYIEDRLGDPALTPTSIAQAHFISVRYLHALFRQAGVTVSAYIRARRLERCRGELADPALAGQTVTAISSRWSFADAAHFSRTFKAAYGETPSEFRSRALG